jgi:hypothetical protein
MSEQNNIIYDSIFWLSLSTIVLATIRYFLKNFTKYCKCSKMVCCWGLCGGERDIRSEIEIERVRIENGLDDKSDDSGERKDNSTRQVSIV